MPEALVHAGRWLRWVDGTGRVTAERSLGARNEQVAELLVGDWHAASEGLLEWIRQRAGSAAFEASTQSLVDWLGSEGLAVRLGPVEQRRAWRAAAFSRDPESRALFLAVARARLAERLRSPEASLAALTREEERVRRVLRREVNAADSWTSEGAPVLAQYARVSAVTRSQLEAHLRELTTTLEREVERLAPNLSAVVGPVVAARLISEAGGLDRLGRLDASRIQLLGARRRFGPGRTPRFGFLFHSEGTDRVPPARAGAFARSVAALAAIAARVDATTKRRVADELVRRRERRIAQLRVRQP